MEQAPTDKPRRLGWILATPVLVALLVWQGWLTLGLFGVVNPWQNLVSANPVVSGWHPLHQYHGWLGARSLYTSGQLCCYDPFNLAGYPKTPIFDSGARPAELCLILAGGEYSPAAYKIGLVVCCLLVPVLLLLAAVGAGLGPGACCLSVTAGLLVWWSIPGQRALEAGDIELLLAGLALLAHVGLLLHYHRSPRVLVWLGLIFTGCLGWFAHPLLFPLVVPLFLVYYLSAGVKHRHFLWHFGLFSSGVLSLLFNAVWLCDWVTHWWIRAPLPQPSGLLAHRTFRTFWEADLWGTRVDRAFGLFVLGSCVAGLLVLQARRERIPARLLGLGALGLFVLALLGISWEPLGRLGTSGLLLPAVWFAALPAACAWSAGARQWLTWKGPWLVKVLVPLGVCGGLVLFASPGLAELGQRCCRPEPLDIGLSAEQEQLVRFVAENSTSAARILWEDVSEQRDFSQWPALLPLLAQRQFLGGLDPQGQIEHSHAGFVRGQLAGRPTIHWSDEGLTEYCERYNIGWAVLWSGESIERFQRWPGAEDGGPLKEGDRQGRFFKIRRSEYGFAIKGQARVVQADYQHITLADVIPEDGRVVLSFHFQKGMRAYPGRVIVEREPDPRDNIPLVRLRLTNPVARLTLTWERR